MTNKNTTPETELLQDAGIIIGWLLWKKRFDQFDWLKDGDFYGKDGMNTGIVAANWLTRLGKHCVDSINPLAATICNLSMKACRYLSDTELESYMGDENIPSSVDNYYSQLMTLWPVLQPNQQTEFKELFVQREGIAHTTPLGLSIAITKEPQDSLMTKSPVPWPLNYIQFPWTSTVIEVKW